MTQKLMTMILLPASKQLLNKSTGVNLQQIQFTQLTRSLSTKTLTPAITFMTNSSTKHIRTSRRYPSLEEHSSDGRPLSVLLCWLMAKNNAVNKYAKFYLDQGFDVLTVRISPWQLLWPAACAPVIQNELLPILQSSDHSKKLIHGFSVGGYIFGQMLKYINEEPERYRPLVNTMRGQIWDSVVDVNGVAIGVSKSVFMNQPFLQKSLQNYIEYHMKVFHNVATKYYIDSHEYFYNKPLITPALFLSSKIDPISTLDVIKDVQNSWHDHGITCSEKLWDNTPHVGHMQRHPEEYKEVVKSFLETMGMKPGRRVIRDKKQVINEDYSGISIAFSKF